MQLNYVADMKTPLLGNLISFLKKVVTFTLFPIVAVIMIWPSLLNKLHGTESFRS